jgi:hypothetical protein
LKEPLFILFFLFFHFFALTQTDTANRRATINSVRDTPATSRNSAAIRKVVDSGMASPVIIRKVKKPVIADTVKKRIVSGTVTRDTSIRRDSFAKADSSQPGFLDSTTISKIDTVRKAVLPIITKKPFDSIYSRLLNNPFITKAKPIYLIVHERERGYKDEIFYLICGLLLFLAFIKLVFSRYFKNVFRLFFQPAFRQKQTREQLQQNNLPSLLLNLFFIFSAGTYITFLIEYYHPTDIGFWWLLVYTNAALLTLYLGKFIFLSFAGWVFDAKEATESYIFAVSLINKIAGVILIPFTLLIAFSQPAIINISVTLSALIISLLFIYRYLISYPSVRRELKVSLLHFFFYIFAFEIMPLLLISKTLIIFLNNSH